MFTFFNKALLGCLFYCLFVPITIAQTLINIHQIDGKVHRAELWGKSLATYQSFYLFHQLLQVPEQYSFVPYHTFADVDGNEHTRYQQYHEGILVDGGEYLVHSRKGVIYAVNGTFQEISTSFNTKPALTEATALTMTMQIVGAREYAWQNISLEKQLKILRKDPNATYYPTPKLSILTKDQPSGMPQLVYITQIKASQPDLDLQVIINAHTGKLIDKSNLICYINGRANTIYNGNNVPIKTSLAPNTTDEYILHDKTNNIRTLNAEGSTLPQGIEYTNYGSNIWGAAQPEHDAHYGATKTVEYWKSTHNRVSYDGNPNTELIQLVNAPSMINSVPTHDNASWTPTQKVARYGNGNITFKHLTSLDVVAHEIGHAYSYGLSLGVDANGNFPSSDSRVWDLHEGFSDIWALCVDRDDWIIGEQVMQPPYASLRSVENPGISGYASLTKGVETYSNAYFLNNFYVNSHSRGLLLSHWFYIVSVGKTTNSYSVQGIGKEYAEKIAYRMYAYLPYNAEWKDVAGAALSATKEIYGECSIQYATVYNALYAVNLLTVGGYANTPMSLPTFTAALPADYSVICDGEVRNASIAYTWGTNTASDRISYEWQISDDFQRLQFIDDLGNTLGNFAFGSQVKFRYTPSTVMNQRQYVTLTARAYCNGNTPSDRRIVGVQQIRLWLGMPDVIKVLLPTTTALCVGETYTVHTVAGEGRASTEWINESPTIWQEVSQGYSFARYRVIDYGTARVSVRVANRCGTTISAPFSAPVTYYCDDLPKCTPRPGRPCPLRFVVAPNPATHSVALKNLDATDHIGTVFSYEVYNTIGNLVGSGTVTDQTALDVSQWQDGLYLVLVQTPQGIQSLKLVVQKGTVAN